MKITETRKAIIELIEPYMDKTLNEGCLVDVDGDNKNIQKVGELDGENAIVNIYGSRWLLRKGKSKTIGHYDITAVFYYIWKKKSDFTLKAEWEWRGSTPFNMSISYRSYWSDHIYKKYIPNKPLHLYTEEEDKQLLELLLKLK